MNYLETYRLAWTIPEIRARILFVLAMFAVYVAGSHIPIPGVDPQILQNFLGGASGGGALGLLDIFSGGNFQRVSIFALGIMPYINASIIFNLLVVVIPQLEQLQKEGESGRRVISQYTRYLTVILAAIQGFALLLTFRGQGGPGGGGLLINDAWYWWVFVIMTLMAGTSFLMWLAEQITEHGIGNGQSLIIFIGIVSALPIYLANDIVAAPTGFDKVKIFGLFVALTAVIVFTIVYVHLAERRITIRYARHQLGQTQSYTHYLPLKVNMAGVIPIIFAVSLLLFPSTIGTFFPQNSALFTWAQAFPQLWYYHVLYFLLTLVFTFFYTAVIFNPKDVADNLKKNGGFLPGIRPGKPTADYLARVLERLTLIGGLYLATVAVVPGWIFQADTFRNLQSLTVLSGTSILIVVGVAIDTVRELDARLTMLKYKKALN
ncbi:MAG TPA: preprotein translocase subunit SecY [bacterium]|nr:preprotein translocase subunit SecY [bacterium]